MMNTLVKPHIIMLDEYIDNTKKMSGSRSNVDMVCMSDADVNDKLPRTYNTFHCHINPTWLSISRQKQLPTALFGRDHRDSIDSIPTVPTTSHLKGHILKKIDTSLSNNILRMENNNIYIYIREVTAN